MNYTFWHGGYNLRDLQWLVKALSDLKNNEWSETSPLYFDGTGWSSSVREEASICLLNALSQNRTARSLFFRNADLDLKAQKALCDVFKQNSTLRCIAIKNLRYGAQPMSIPLELFQNKSLQDLSLAQCLLDRPACDALGKMVRESRSLKSLSLTNVNLEGGVGALTAALSTCRSLQKLHLERVQISAAELKELLSALGRNSSLTSAKLEQMELGPDNVVELAKMVAENCGLVELSLRKNNINGECTKTLVDEGLLKNESLETLFLSDNPVGDDGAAALVTGLEQNATLQRLCLIKCEIWQAGCKALARGMPRFLALRKVSLDCNDFEECVEDLLDGVKHNVLIEHVLDTLAGVVKNGDDKDLWQQVDLHLRMNKAKRRFFVETHQEPALLPVVLEKSNQQPDVMFQFFRNYPFIVATPEAAKSRSGLSHLPRAKLLAPAGAQEADACVCA